MPTFLASIPQTLHFLHKASLEILSIVLKYKTICKSYYKS